MVALEGIIAWAAIVVVTMLVVGYLAQRWGRDPFGWLLLSAVMGPIALVGLVGTRHADLERAEAAGTPQRTIREHLCALVPVDGSPSSAAAAQHAANLSEEYGEVVLLAVLPHEAAPRTAGSADRDHDAKVAKMTEPAMAALGAQGGTPRVAIAYGAPGEAIVRAADAEGADAIIIGRRGAGLSRALLGSTSDYVVKHARQPVTVIG